ncbi:MAG: TIGR00341 family protein [Nitrospirota bacterium]|nr:TIGR00341 family protein [Nitrospirota bacterium]
MKFRTWMQYNVFMIQSKLLARAFFFIKRWLGKKASKIDHSEVLKDIYLESTISTSYFLLLTIANLIALSGLITNSAPAIIGAMLISPLMSPMLSIGFAFITGDQYVWTKSLKKIVLGVALTIVAAAFATYLSPLKDVTSEILSRTRPNLYDLIVALLAGAAGAAALCTKKNYLTIVPGVAIATAVIPPLSVAGFGIGIWNFRIFAGGFFLFFTNFVAIVIATCLVFFLYGFRPVIIGEESLTQLKRRVGYLSVILVLISIPLFYTLHQSIAAVRLRGTIESVLKNSLNREGQSRLSTFSYLKRKDGKLEINSTVNTISYMKEKEVSVVEKNLEDALRKEVKLYLEQIQVQPGGLKEPKVKASLEPAIAPPKPPQEIIKSSREGTLAVIRQSAEKIEKVIAPSTIADFNVAFHDKSFKISMMMKVKRDKPLSEEEILWLRRIIATDLNIPVDLTVETVPFVPLIIFGKGQTALTPEMKQTIMTVRDISGKNEDLNLMVEAYTGTYDLRKHLMKLSDERVAAVRDVLIRECNIRPERIETVVRRSKKIEAPAVKISVLSPEGG